MITGPRRTVAALVTVAAVAAVVFAGCGEGDDGSTRAGLSGAVRTPPLEVGAVSLPDESPGAGGAPFLMQAAPGGLLLVYFGFTSCPDICPTTLSDLGRAVQKLGSADRDRVDVAMVTVDPERDTGEILTSYLDTFVKGGGIALRTTDPVQLQAAQDAFRVVDEHGTVVLEWPFGTSPDSMRGDLGILLRRAER